ncbi:hypothetical protein C9374_005481 [Naegleria lovaniensis]|uniref:Uncharacterized protein n=1 Tax=Naegleria lovaniensis TaxID=51637 RepID=A0AA88KHY4_NAELO|nr:uncharacterized protein C9374_005481 [Naegleria lovaniensis]KAG2382279.1 hypothetical protein C9374_005481 [Naegleria lovaniensis]
MKRKITAPSAVASTTSSSQQVEGKDASLEALNKKMKYSLMNENKPILVKEENSEVLLTSSEASAEESQISIDSIGSIESLGSIILEEEDFISVKEDQPFLSSELNQGDEEIDHINTKPVIQTKINLIEKAIDFYGLPRICGELFREIKGVNKLYDWQEKLLGLEELKSGRNVVYSLPTSGGKTLIAEILMIRNCQILKKKSLLVLPYVSICEEKCASLELFSDHLNFFVEGYFGSKGALPVEPGNQLIISTIEKANLIIDSLVKENRIHELGCVVIDELHMLGEGDRGQLLENLLTKILYIQREKKNVEIIIDDTPIFEQNSEKSSTTIEKVSIQIIGMSATIPNLESIAQWMDATLYTSDYRPVPLVEYYTIGEAVFDKQGNNIRNLNPIPFEVGKGKADPDFITSLCCEVIPANSVLVFCPTKQSCEDCVKHLSQTLPISKDYEEEKEKLISDLKLLGNEDSNLLNGIKYGVAYHHSSLATEERALIENAYRNHVICVICCTSTLAAGINLPAARVIFNTPYIGYKQFLTKAKYLQMAGRAGRAGIDTFGESFLVLQKQYKAQVDGGKELISKPLENVNSCINVEEADSLSRVCLEVVSSGLVSTMADIEKFISYTFCTFQTPDLKQKLIEQFRFVVSQLAENKLINMPSESSSGFEMTSFGLGASRSTLTLKQSLELSDLLKNAMDEGIILSDELHLLYLIGIPVDGNGLLEPNYVKFFNYIEQKATSTEKKILQRCKTPEQAIVTKAMNKFSKITDLDNSLVKRMYNAFILRDIINESTSFLEYCEIRGRGNLQQLMSQSTTFCNMAQQFCEKLEYWHLAKMAKRYTKRIQYGAKQDLIDLVQLEGVKRPEIARILKNCDLTLEKLNHFLSEAENEEIPLSLMDEENAKQIMATHKLLEHVKSFPHSPQILSFIDHYFTHEKMITIMQSAKRELSRKAFYLRAKSELLEQ